MSEKRAAILVNLDICKFSNELNDKSTAHTVAKGAHARESQDKYIRRRIPIQFLREVNSISNTLYQTHIRYSVPWLDGGLRILPSNNILRYMAMVGDLRTSLDDKVLEVSADMPEIDVYNRRFKGNLYRATDVPSPQEFIDAYSVNLTLIPLPSVEDFRLEKMSKEDSDREKGQYKDFMDTSMGNILPHVVQLYREPLDRMLKTAGNDVPRFFDTVYDRLENTCEIALDMLVDNKGRAEIEKLNDLLYDEVLRYPLHLVRKDTDVSEKFIRGLLNVDAFMKGTINGLIT